VYGQVLNYNENNSKYSLYLTNNFSKVDLSKRCFIAQPGTIIKKNTWSRIGGLSLDLNLSMDYDLWWNIYRNDGNFFYYKNAPVAVNRIHQNTKTNEFFRQHYRESIYVLKKNNIKKIHIRWHLAILLKIVINLLK
jgi:hypothetical protein